MKIEGNVFWMPETRFDDINTDEILSGPFMRIPEEELADHAFEGIVPEFKKQVEEKEILVAGENMGCGSSREQAPKALIGCGLKAVIAKSFGYIFYRNAINLGLTLIKVSDEIMKQIKDCNHLKINITEGYIETEQTKIQITPLEAVNIKILEAGGLLPYIKENDSF